MERWKDGSSRRTEGWKDGRMEVRVERKYRMALLGFRTYGLFRRYACAPPANSETFCEKINASSTSGKELAGLKKKEKKMKNDVDDTKIVKSRMSEFSRGRLKVRMRSWGI